MTTPARSNRWEAILEQSAAAFLAGQLASNDADNEPGETGGARIGAWRLLEEIGRGGMGVVWLAERADGQFEQRVALKLVKRGMDTAEILHRFRREQQILARLEHPHIARLLDGGVSPDGRPYFVMEYIRGEPITAWCDRRRLHIQDRLRLFVVVCRAIQFAHRSLVVHRDLKPSNVLVTDDGGVKLLDFGVAKLLDDEGETPTAIRRAPITPEYASPEQLAGTPVTTSSDVYQLGVLFYELLSGHRPWRRGDRAAKTPVAHDPPRPSTAVRSIERIEKIDGSARIIEPSEVSASRDSTPDRLSKLLRGDLDRIALAALRREPEHRPPSADALADEIERYLAGQPIRLRDNELSYRTSRFIARHRTALAAAALAASALTSGAVFYTIRIQRERDAALDETAKQAQGAELVRRMFADWNPDAANRGAVSASAILHNAVRSAETELKSRPHMLASSLSMLGGLYTSIGDTGAANALLTRALNLQEQYSAPAADRAATLARRGRLFMYTRDRELATNSLRHALNLYRSVFGRRRIETLRVQRDLANHLRSMGEMAESESLLRGILDALEPEERGSAFALEAEADLGYMLLQLARYDEAIPVLEKTLDQQHATLGKSNASVLVTTRFLASALRDRGDLARAERLYRDALQLARDLYGPDHVQSAYADVVLSILLERKGNLEEAERLAREGITILGSNNVNTPLELIRLGGIRLDRGDAVEAERWLRLGLDSLRQVYATRSADEADALNRLAYLLLSRGAPDAAQFYREAVDFDRARSPGSPVFVSDGLHFLAWAHQRQGDFVQAESTYRRALDLYRVQLPPDHAYIQFAQRGLEEVVRQRAAHNK